MMQNTFPSQNVPLLAVKMTSLYREIYFQIKIYKIYHYRIFFRSYDIEKVYVVVVQNTFSS
jgi:hypothetical protein